MSNKELIDEFLNSTITSNLAKATLLTRLYCLKELDKHTDKSFLELTATDIRNFIIKKKESGAWSHASTIAVSIMIIKLFYKFLISENFIKEENNPMKKIKAPKQSFDYAHRPLNKEEIKALVKTADYAIISPRNKLIFYLAMTTGIRSGEICNIKKENINLEEKLIFLPREDVKGSYRSKLIPVTEKVKELIGQYLIKFPNLSEYLFVNKSNHKLSPLTIYLSMRTIINEAFPVKGTWRKPFGAHIARHTFASRWIEAKGDVHALRAIMGWRSFAQLDRYVNVSPTFIKEAVGKVERKLLAVK